MKSEADYQLKDLDCKNALMVLFEQQAAGEWLKNYQSLYESVIIGPAGLPAIVNAHANDVFYAFISLFGHTYQSLIECQSDLF